MCGIGAIVLGAVVAQTESSEEKKEQQHHPTATNAPTVEEFEEVLKRRGPDSISSTIIEAGKARIVLVASVLHLRGPADQVTVQPLKDSQGNVLLWNGEIFGGIEVPEGKNDTAILLEELRTCDSVPAVFARIQGPGAFVYWQAKSSTLWYGRDILGRRSLLTSLLNTTISSSKAKDVEEHALILSSIALRGTENEKTLEAFGWHELSTTGIFSLTLTTDTTREISVAKVCHHFWGHVRAANPGLPLCAPSNVNRCPLVVAEVLPFSRSMECIKCPSPSSALLDVLSESVRKRVTFISQPSSKEHARVGILFSGGIDCSVLAALADRHLPPDEPIDLINVAFAGHLDHNALRNKVPDRVTAINGFLELKNVSPKRPWRLIEANIQLEDLERNRDHIVQLIHPTSTVMDFNIGSIMWFGTVGRGLVRDHQNQVTSSFGRYAKQSTSSNTSSVLQSERQDDEKKQQQQHEIYRDTNDYYTTHARVLLTGIGADEQFAGYGRHRTVFRKGGTAALQSELNKDFKRIWRRNLGLLCDTITPQVVYMS